MEIIINTKRCPFCNGWDLTMDVTQATYQVRCLDCGCTGPFSTGTRDLAVAMWNATYLHQNPSAMVSCKTESNRNDMKMLKL